jgi:hypothetical protein
MKKKNNLFTVLDAINFKDKEYCYNKKDCTAYMLLLWFSHNKESLPIVEKINKHLFDLKDEIVYTYLYNTIPKGKKFLKWDKGKKDKKLLKKEEKILKSLKDNFSMSDEEALMIYKMYKEILDG